MEVINKCYPLYSIYIYSDNTLDHITHKDYHLVIITLFTGPELTAKEVSHKAFYIAGDVKSIKNFFEGANIDNFYTKYKQHSKFTITAKARTTYNVLKEV